MKVGLYHFDKGFDSTSPEMLFDSDRTLHRVLEKVVESEQAYIRTPYALTSLPPNSHVPLTCLLTSDPQVESQSISLLQNKLHQDRMAIAISDILEMKGKQLTPFPI